MVLSPSLFCHRCGCDHIFAMHEYIQIGVPTPHKYACMLTLNPSKGCGEEVENCFYSKKGHAFLKSLPFYSSRETQWQQWCYTLAKVLYFTLRTIKQSLISFQFTIFIILGVCLLLLLYPTSLFSTNFSFFSCIIFLPLHFKGVPPQVVASGLRPGPERSPQAFNGCIHNVRINGEPQDLSYRSTGGGRLQGVAGKVITILAQVETFV